MPTDDSLYRKLRSLIITLVEGYPSCGSEAMQWPTQGPISLTSKVANQVVRPVFLPESQPLCYVIMEYRCITSSYTRISRQAGLASTPPTSRHISQETRQKWEKSAREASVICNQAASFNRSRSSYSRECRTS